MEETHIAHHFNSALLLKSGEAENIIMTVDALFSSGTWSIFFISTGKQLIPLFLMCASCCSFLIHFLCLVYIAMSFETLPLFALHNSSPTVQEVTTVSGS